MQLKDKKVLITGGSRGIGKCMINELVKHGVQDIAVIARDKKKLKELNCDEVQGFYFGRPVTAEAFTKLLIA